MGGNDTDALAAIQPDPHMHFFGVLGAAVAAAIPLIVVDAGHLEVILGGAEVKDRVEDRVGNG